MVSEKIEGVHINSCCYSYHVQMAELKDGYNSMHSGLSHQNCDCTCNVYRPGGV
jgi:hypothetical protein